MSSQLNPSEYYSLVKNIYQLILDEIESVEAPEKIKFLHIAYPKLVICNYV